MSSGKTIAKNASVLMVSQLATWILTLLLTMFLPRFLGPKAVGQFHFANSLWAIAAISIAFGMDRLLTKEIARDPDKTSEMFGATVIARAILYLVGFGGIALYLYLLDYPQETVWVVFIIGIAQFFWQFSSAVTAVLQGLEQMQYISIANIAAKTFNTVVAIVLLLLGYGVLVIAAVTIGTALVSLLVMLHYLRRLYPLRLRARPQTIAKMLRAGSPYLLTRLSLVVYMQVDIVIISLLVNEETIGWYGAADQLFGTFLFIPTVFMTAVFPALSRMYTSDSDSLSRLMGKSFNLLLLLSVPIGLGLVVVANPLVVLLFGSEFVNSGPVLATFGIVLILTYQNMLLGQFLVSTDRQNKWTVVMVVATIATIPLDLLLIPWCVRTFGNGAIGGAIAFVITEAGMTIAGLSLLPKGSLNKATVSLALRTLLAGLAMLAAAWLVRDLFIAVPIIVGGIVYLTLAWLLRAIDREDAAMLWEMGQGILGRLRRKSKATEAAGA